MRHLLTIGINNETGLYCWRCSCGTESRRKDLSWGRVQSGARTHEETAGMPPVQVLALYSVFKWVLALVALVAPLAVGARYGPEAMLWCAGSQLATFGACVLDHLSSLVDQRAESFTLQDL